jgi:hypothetical protein
MKLIGIAASHPICRRLDVTVITFLNDRLGRKIPQELSLFVRTSMRFYWLRSRERWMGMPQFRTQKKAYASNENSTILAWSKSKIAWIRIWGVGGPQTIKEETHRSVGETCERWVGSCNWIATVKPAKRHSQNRYEECLVESEIMSWSVWKFHREEEIRAFADMIVHNKAA